VTVFVTGATGFLGTFVVEALLRNRHNVRVLVRHPTRHLPEAVESVIGTVDDPSTYEDALKDVESVIHLAGKVSYAPKDAAEMHALHIGGTRAVMATAQKAGVRRVVVASTSGTVSLSPEPQPHRDEQHTPALEHLTRFPYYASKFYQEKEVLDPSTPGPKERIVLNPSLLLGPGDRRLSSTRDVLELLNRRYPFAPTGTIAFVDVRDAADVFVRALEAGRPGRRYVLNAVNMAIPRFAEHVATLGGTQAPRIAMGPKWSQRLARGLDIASTFVGRDTPFEVERLALAQHHFNCTAQAANQDFDFQPRNPMTTLFDTVRHFESIGLYRRPN
jgi:dihydroflavonol-4-reductase